MFKRIQEAETHKCKPQIISADISVTFLDDIINGRYIKKKIISFSQLLYNEF